MVQEIRRSTRREREEWISTAHYNLFKLESKGISIDLLANSGKGDMSDRQWAAWTRENDTCTASSPVERAKDMVRHIFGFEHILIVRQCRGGENILFSLLVGENTVIPANSHFDTSRALIESRQATAEDCPLDEAFCIENYHPFKGNIDIGKLESVLRAQIDNVPFVLVSITCSKSGGQPISMENLRQVKRLAREYGVPVVFNSERFAENAWFIKQREPGYATRTIKEIVREMHQYADVMIISADISGLAGAGSILAMSDHTLFKAAFNSTILLEEQTSCGEMASRYMEALTVGLDEATCENHLTYQMGKIERFGEKLKRFGIPIQQPFGGHAIMIDAASFLPNVPREEFVAQTLAVELYLEAGVRGLEIGTLMNDRDPDTGHNRYADVEFMCLTIPRRIYMNEHLDLVAKALVDIYGRRSAIKYGLQIMEESSPRRYLTVILGKVADDVERQDGARDRLEVKKERME